MIAVMKAGLALAMLAANQVTKMARTPPTNKAKQRAQALQDEVAIDPTMDPEMRSTLTQERARRVAFKKMGEATSEVTYDRPKKKRKGLLETLTGAFKPKAP
jgi:hypothetical protein